MVGDFSGVREHGRNEQVLGPGVCRALHDVHVLPPRPRRGHGERGLADSRVADHARRERQVRFGEREPAGEDLAQRLGLSDPRDVVSYRVRKDQFDIVYGHFFHEFLRFLKIGDVQ